MEPSVSPAKAYYGVSQPGVGGSWGKAMRLRDLEGSPLPATPAPDPGSCHLAQKLQGLRKNMRQDEKLQQLKARIQQQQQRCILRALREHRMLAMNSAESPAHLQPHLKRKVCKMAVVSPPPFRTGRRGRVAEKTQGGSNAVAPLEKARKEQAARSMGAFSWREGQKLATKILGPRLKYPKPSGGCEQNVGRVPPEPKRYGTTGEARGGLGENEPALKRVRGQVEQERKGNGTLVDKESSRGSKNRSTRPQNNLAAETTTPMSRRATGREDGGRAKRGPGGVAGFPSPSAPLVDPAGPSAAWMRPRRDSSQRGHVPGKENQPTPHTEARGGRRSPQSPEQIRAFMDKKWAERKQRSREEKRASQQAQEAKNARLQDVYRKQKEALRRRKSRAEVQLENGTVRSTTPTKDICGLERAREKRPKSERMGWLPRSSQALLRSETHLHSAVDLETTRRTGGPTAIDSPEVVSCCSTPESFLPPKDLIFGFREWSPWQKPTLSPSQTKQERIKAVWLLAQDLSERLDREMGMVELANRSTNLESKGEPSGEPTVSEPPRATLKPAMPPVSPGAAVDGGAVWDSSCPQDPPRGAGKTQETVAVCGDGLADHIEAGQLRLLTSGPGCAVRDGLPKDKNLHRGDARPEVLMAMSQFPPGRQSTSSQAERYIASPHHPGLQEDDVQNCFGLPLGQAGHTLSQHQTCGRSSPSALPPHSSSTVTTEEPADKSEPTDSTSQWSEIGHFYGSSRTFGRFGLSMVEQSLREEELHARHRMALLRLREKALREKTQAELAWLEHEASSQKSSGDGEATSAFLEKQSALLTELKQELAEIWHLQNLCKVAHQERKLLLKQQKELLMLQQVTAQLWNQLSAESGKPPQQVPSSPNEGTNDAPHSGRSREGSGHIPQQVEQKDRRDISPRGVQTEQELWEQKARLEAQCPEPFEVGARGLYSFRNQPAAVGSAGHDGSKLEEDREGEDTGLRNYSKDDLRSPSQKEPGGWASVVPCAERRSFSPYSENPCLDSEFHQARAVFITLSGSSRSTSDAEAEGGQETDVSLPEEFVFQEEDCHHSSGRLADPPALPETVASSRDAVPPDRAWPVAFFGGYSTQGHVSVPCLQQKTLEDPLDGERIEEGRSVQANRSASGRNPSSSLACDPEPCAERQGPEEADFQGAAESAAASSSADAPRQGLEGAALGTADGPWGGGENTPHLGGEHLTHAPEAFSESAEPVQSTWPRDQRQPTPSLSPSPLATRSGPEGRADVAEASRTSREDHSPLRCPRTSKEDDSARVILPCPDRLGRRTQGSEKSWSENAQSTEKSGMGAHHPSSPEGLGSRDTTVLPRMVLLYEVEEEIVSPVDEVLSYGSADLSSTDKEASFPTTDLPPPPQDLSGSYQDSQFGFQDFPTPPGDGALPYALEEEDLSVETNDLPPSGNLPSPLPALSGVLSSNQGIAKGP